MDFQRFLSIIKIWSDRLKKTRRAPHGTPLWLGRFWSALNANHSAPRSRSYQLFVKIANGFAKFSPEVSFWQSQNFGNFYLDTEISYCGTVCSNRIFCTEYIYLPKRIVQFRYLSEKCATFFSLWSFPYWPFQWWYLRTRVLPGQTSENDLGYFYTTYSKNHQFRRWSKFLWHARFFFTTSERHPLKSESPQHGAHFLKARFFLHILVADSASSNDPSRRNPHRQLKSGFSPVRIILSPWNSRYGVLRSPSKSRRKDFKKFAAISEIDISGDLAGRGG